MEGNYIKGIFIISLVPETHLINKDNPSLVKIQEIFPKRVANQVNKQVQI